ncbi:MAG: acetate--CoA ligase [Proteobacteria bacterium]|nr:acetate--CoA ligase [Pseudomonadota bacterium]
MSQLKQMDIVNFKLNQETYSRLYQQSINEPNTFWAEQGANFVTWFVPWQVVNDSDFSKATISWFKGAKLNVCFNCLDRHLAKKANQVAIFWEGDNAHRRQVITYQRLYERVCRFANSLKTVGVSKGDKVCIYLPMIPEAMIAMLACARIGAVHTVVFGGFSPRALRERIQNAGCKVIITADEGIRNATTIPLKKNVDAALSDITVRKVIVIKNSGTKVAMHSPRDIWYHELAYQQSEACEVQWMDAEDPLFILYTSGSTGKPKGIIHTSGGYLLYAAMTFRYVFDYQAQDIFWCTADMGWITGHSYGVYGPLANGATLVMYEGLIAGASPYLVWEIVDRYQVSIFYTAPTAIRTLMASGDAPLANSKRDSLRILGTVGEPINPEAWRWYHQKVGKGKCWIVDTWWQTETGGIMIAPLPGPGKEQQKPGAACQPFLGIKPLIVDENGKAVVKETQGFLTIAQSWPGQARGIYANPARFDQSYFSQYKGLYFTGDGAFQDKDGDYWITGRVDDVINVAGHRLGTAEIESALVRHPLVAEAAVIGVPHPVKGESVFAFVTLISSNPWQDSLIPELQQEVIVAIGKLAKPDKIVYAPKLPKTRSGKIMRRLLRCIAADELDKLGDISTLAEPEVIEQLKAALAAEKNKLE